MTETLNEISVIIKLTQFRQNFYMLSYLSDFKNVDEDTIFSILGCIILNEPQLCFFLQKILSCLCLQGKQTIPDIMCISVIKMENCHG